MNRILTLILFIAATAFAQPKTELAPAGFSTVTVTIPASVPEKMVELTKNWALEANRRGSFDVSEVTTNTITVTANKKDAFYYRSKGEGYDHDIRYDLKLNFSESSYTATFVVKEIYADNVRIESTVADFFSSDGAPKVGFEDVKPSLEATANTILKSHYNFILNFRN